MTARRIPVLMYHRVDQPANRAEARYCIRPQDFAAHMQRLARKGWHPCTLTQFLEWREGSRLLPERSVLITFDDGFLGVHRHALPILQQLGWSATVFLVSARLGGRDDWHHNDQPEDYYPLMDVAELRDLQQAGFDLHSHTRHHPDLTSLDDRTLEDELAGSRRELEDRLQQPVTCLAYPYGRFDDRVADATRAAGYRYAFSTRPGFNRPDIDRYRLRRLDIAGTDTPAMLERKLLLGTNDGSLRHYAGYYLQRAAARLRS